MEVQGKLMAKRKYENAQGGYDPPHLTRLRTTLPGWWLLELRNRYGIEQFVETGTCCADTTVLAALVFKYVWTVDIAHDYDQQANERLKHYPHVFRTHGDSADWLRKLPQLRELIDVPTVYWLDAHWCGQAERQGPECPLLSELAAIGPLTNRDVILIDDADFFVDGPYRIVNRDRQHRPEEWPTYSDILAAVDDFIHVRISENIIIITTVAMARFPSE